MKKNLLVFLSVFVTSYAFSQVSIIESFDSGTPTGWTDSYANTTSQVCAGNSERDNLYSGSSTGNMTSPNQVASSNGTDITFSIDYKVVDWSAATDPTADGWGSADLQYSTDDGATWITAGTIDDTNDSNSNVCMTYSTTILGASVASGVDLKFQVANTWAAGDYYFYIDNFTATQVAANPPNCDAVLTSVTTDFPIDGTLTWSAATGGPTGYRISIGSTMGGTDIANNVDLGATTSYTPTGLMYSTTYFTTITPYNANGGATGCIEQMFATVNPPPTGSICSDPLDVGTLPYMAAAETTAGFGDDYSGTPGASGCGSTSPYLNGDDKVYSYTSDEDGAIAIDLTAITDNYTGVFVYSSCPDVGVACLAGVVNGFSSADLSIPELSVTNGSTYYIVVSTWASPQTTTYDLSIIKKTCAAPTVTIPADPIDNTNCPTTVDVSISIDDLGDSAMVTVSGEDDMGNPVGTGGVTGLGIFTVTNVPVPQSSWSIKIAHESDPSCDVILGPFVLNCPPGNDAACDAETVTVDAAPIMGTTFYSTGETSEPEGSCWGGTGTQESVWYTFEAPVSGNVIVSTDFDTGLNDTHIAIYSTTDCADFATYTEVGCSEDEGDAGANGWNSIVEIAGLTPAEVYYVQVDGYSGSDGDFMIEVTEPPAPVNDDCAAATLIDDSGTTGSGAATQQGFGSATPSGLGAEACEGGTASMNQLDVWYEITTDGAGDLIVKVTPGPNSDPVIALYNACGDGSPEYCVDGGGAGVEETINATAFFKSGVLESSTRADQFFLRVYEKEPTGETFDVSVQGSALPIELASFDADAMARGNKVTWSTVSEINSDFVEVMASPNGSTKWSSVGIVNTKGESSSRVDYEIMDNNPYAVTYYRLKAVDKDGKEEMSFIINVARDDKAGRMVLSPNPTSNFLSLQTASTIEENGTVRIMDLTGQILQNRSVSLKKGLNTVEFDLNELPAGVYLFTLNTSAGTQVERIVKQ